MWNPDTWREAMEAWLAEMRRVLKPGSYIVLFELLGTGNERPIKLDHLQNFYPWLDEVGFQKNGSAPIINLNLWEKPKNFPAFSLVMNWGIRCCKITGDLPECTGVWWLKICQQ